jgi:hypothetical protein
MLDFISSVMDAQGGVPSVGDSDDAVMVRFCPDRTISVYRSLLATGATLFDRRDFKLKAGSFDDKSRWLLGDAAADKFEGLSADRSISPTNRSFPSGGYYILGADFETDEEIRIVADAGPLGYLAIAAHGHADALSFTLSLGGEAILVDPGTYTYQNGAQRDTQRPLQYAAVIQAINRFRGFMTRTNAACESSRHHPVPTVSCPS